ncbi:MAG: dihydroorotate dehydrogenase [Bacteroidales bacterium]|nr:dihydroorotate dehydrogenase [Bacteroidales bacterium]
MVKDLSIQLFGLTLRNPVIAASGTFGFGTGFDFDVNAIGGIALKGTTAEARPGNPCPRVADCTAGMLNSVGLENPGIEVLVREKVPALREIYSGVVIANIGGFSAEEYAFCCTRADESEGIDIIELNISCPNVHAGGAVLGSDAVATAGVVRAARKTVRRKPLVVKLSPNVTDIAAIGRICEKEGADGLTVANTFLGMRIDLKTGKPVLANTFGGFSGPAIFPLALRAVWQVSHACGIPVIGCGGVSSGKDVMEMMMAGASAVQVGAASIRNPRACITIINELACMKK